MVMDKRPPLDEWLSLFEATVAAEGVTTGPGAAAGTSIVDAGLALSGAKSFLSMLMVLYPGQPRLVDSMDITGFTNGTGEVIFSTAYKGIAAAIPAGVPYKIVTFRFVPAEVAAIEAKLDDGTSGLAALKALIDAKAMGRLQVATKIWDLLRAGGGAGTDVLFTGSAQAVVLVALIVRMPTLPNVTDGDPITSLAVATDDAEPGIIIPATDAPVAKMTPEAQFAWTGALYIPVATEIEGTITGGDADAECLVIVTALYRAVVAGGLLT